MNCNNCYNSRIIISENGYHTWCMLPGKLAAECAMNNYKDCVVIPHNDSTVTLSTSSED